MYNLFRYPLKPRQTLNYGGQDYTLDGDPIQNGERSNWYFTSGRPRLCWRYPTPSTTCNKIYDSNVKAKNAILNGLIEAMYVKLMHCTSEKYILDKLKNIYEGEKRLRRLSFKLLEVNLSN